MKIKDRIYIKEWLSLKPYKIHTTTDTYYLKLCNDVKKAIMSNVSVIVLFRYLGMRETHILCCFLTSYFEDLISKTNIWNAFVKKHTEMYGKQLPFYDLEDYYEEEINHQDACFLIWYFLNTTNDYEIISPFNEFITLLAEEVMKVFEEAWDYAPENSQLKTYYQLDEDEENFYIARNLVEKILFETYLFYPDTYFRLLDKEAQIIEDAEYNNTYNKVALLTENRDTTTHTIHTCLLSLKGSEWASEILGNDHPVSEHYKEITTKVVGFFLYKGQDERYVCLEHVASGKHFNLLKYSFDEAAKLIEIDTIVYIGLVRWRNDWWFSGTYFQEEYDDDLIQSEKKSLHQIAMVNFLDQNREERIAPIIENQHRVFKEMNGDSIIAFMPANEIDGFIKRFNNQLNLAILADQEEKEVDQKLMELPQNDNPISTKIDESEDPGLVFFNINSGVEIVYWVNSAFPLPENYFYDPDESEQDTIALITSDEISKELALYCVENFKDDLPLFKNDDTWKSYLRDFDFLLRFWKKHQYHAKYEITLSD